MFKIGILTISDSSSEQKRKDLSGPKIKSMLSNLGNIEILEILPDKKILISKKLKFLSDVLRLDLIITTGGTGFSKKDVTPEATLSVIDRIVPGIPEIMRYKSMQKTNNAILSRAVAGIRKKTLIINLPGSPIACEECLNIINKPLIHGLNILKGIASNCSRK